MIKYRYFKKFLMSKSLQSTNRPNPEAQNLRPKQKTDKGDGAEEEGHWGFYVLKVVTLHLPYGELFLAHVADCSLWLYW
jgi:hypothetical protein